MTIKITGSMPKVQRLLTGLWSFDKAFENQRGEIGLPLGTIIEIYGPHSSGKSTTTYGLSGLIGKQLKCDIALLDLEGFDPEFLLDVLENSKFDGELHYLQKAEDEEAMDLLVSTVGDKKRNFGVGILDSIGAISPISEAEGDLGEANMGKRAKLLGQFSRKATKVIRDYKDREIYKTFIMINHELPNIGGRGTYTPGGFAKEYLSGVRIKLRVAYVKGKYEVFPDGSYVLEGEVKKNKVGMKSRKFYLFMLNGKGIHQGLTWMYDGIRLGINSRTSAGIKIGGQSIGRLKEIIMKAHAGEDDFFQPFHDAIYNKELILPEIEDEQEESNTDSDQDN